MICRLERHTQTDRQTDRQTVRETDPTAIPFLQSVAMDKDGTRPEPVDISRGVDPGGIGVL